jgi:hypothetical protein
VDASTDTGAIIASGGSPLAALLTYRNLVPDIMALTPQIGQIPTEAKALSPADYVTLTAALAADLSLSNAAAEQVATTGIDLLQEIVIVLMPKIKALALAVKSVS